MTPKASAKQTSDDLKTSVKESQDEMTQWWSQVQERLEVPRCQGS